MKVKSVFSEFKIVNLYETGHKNCIGAHTYVTKSSLVEPDKYYALCIPKNVKGPIEVGSHYRFIYFATEDIIDEVKSGKYTVPPSMMKLERLTSDGWQLIFEGTPEYDDVGEK